MLLLQEVSIIWSYCISNNIDLRPAKFREQYAKGYEGMDDAKITETVMARLPKAFIPALEKIMLMLFL